MEKITPYYVENPTVFDQLMKPVETLIKEQSEKLTSHHNEKFFFPDFFRLLIYYFVSGTQSIGLLINALKKTHYLRNSSYAELLVVHLTMLLKGFHQIYLRPYL